MNSERPSDAALIEGLLRAFAVGFLTSHWWGTDRWAGLAILVLLGYLVADVIRWFTSRKESR